jgi:hypothetical protein
VDVLAYEVQHSKFVMYMYYMHEWAVVAVPKIISMLALWVAMPCRLRQ